MVQFSSNMADFLRKHKVVISLFFLAFIVRLIFFFVAFSHHQGDLVATIKGDDGYYELSQSVLHGRGFTWDTEPPYRLNTLRPPLWPGLIALLAFIGNGSYVPVILVLLVMGSLIPMIGYKIVLSLGKLYGDPRSGRTIAWNRVALITAIALCLEPYSILLSTIMYTETSFTFLFTLGLLFLFTYFREGSWRSIVWSAVFMGLATMIKPTIQYIPILVPLFILVFKWFTKSSRVDLVKASKQGVIFAVVIVSIIAPWLYANKKVYGVARMGAQPAFNLYVYLAPTVLAINNGTSFRTEYENFVKKDPNFNELDINLANGSYYSSKAIEIIKGHKVALVKSVGMTVVTFFTHDGMVTFFQYAGKTIAHSGGQPSILSLLDDPADFAKTLWDYMHTAAAFAVIVRIIWYLVTLCIIVGTIRLFVLYPDRKSRLITTLVILIVAYFALTTAVNGFGVNARFRVPVLALMFALAAHGAIIGQFLLRLIRYGRSDSRKS
jgi:hypothetical protein